MDERQLVRMADLEARQAESWCDYFGLSASAPSTIPRLLWGSDAARGVRFEIIFAALSNTINEDRLQEVLLIHADLLERVWNGDPEAAAALRHVAWRTRISDQNVSEILDRCIAGATLAVELTVRRLADSDVSEHDIENALEQLRRVPGFEDPLRKKALLVCHRLVLAEYVTSAIVRQSADYAIDKHITRLAIRLGWIDVSSDELLVKLAEQVGLTEEEDFALRSTVSKAMHGLFDRPNLDRPRFNSAVWQFARGVCRDPGPACTDVTAQPCSLAGVCRAHRLGTAARRATPRSTNGYY